MAAHILPYGLLTFMKGCLNNWDLFRQFVSIIPILIIPRKTNLNSHLMMV